MIQHYLPMTHVIDSIKTKKTDYYNPIHCEVIHRPCKFLDVNKGERGWIGYEPEYDPGGMHRLHVSEIQNIICEDGSESGMSGNVLIETEYSYYHFTPIDLYRKEDDAT